MMSRITVLGLVLALGFSTASHAEIKEDNYVVMEGDFNADGVTDYLMQSLGEKASVPYDIEVFLSGVSYLLQSQSGQYVVAVASPTVLASAAWSASTASLHYADFNGDGKADVLLKSNVGGQSLLLDGSAAIPQLTQITSNSVLAASSSSVDVRDVNGDGRADLVLISTQGEQTILSAADGKLPGLDDANALPVVRNIIAGSAAVSDSGSASYSVPISLPPGRGGHMPSLAMSYNSRSGSSVLGTGWQLSGLSKLHRCAPVLDIDGQVGARPYKAEEKWCVDGKRLVETAEADVFAFEVDNQSRGQFSGSGNSLSFQLKTKSGSVLTYGGTNDSRVVSEDDVIHLSVSRVADQWGNSYSVAYDTSTADKVIEQYPASISYAPNVKVEFKYESRFKSFDAATKQDYMSSYRGEREFRNTKLVDKIEISIADKIIHDLDPVYERSSTTGKFRMASLNECRYSLQGGEKTCALASEFKWSEGEQGYEAEQNLDGLSSTQYTGQRPVYADLNGDGYSDIVWAQDGAWHVAHGTGVGYSPAVSTGVTTGADPDVSGLALPVRIDGQNKIGLVVGVNQTYFIKWYVIDFERSFTGLYTGHTKSRFLGHTRGAKPIIVDINKDGMDDIYFSYEEEIASAYRDDENEFEQLKGISVPFSDHAQRVNKIQSGGATTDVESPSEVMKYSHSYVAFRTSSEIGEKGDYILQNQYLDTPEKTYSTKVLDLDGNGIQDIVTRNSFGTVVKVSYHKEDIKLKLEEDYPKEKSTMRTFCDTFGATDSSSCFEVLLNQLSLVGQDNSASYAQIMSKIHLPGSSNDFDNSRFIDINADGLLDFVYRDNSSKEWRVHLNKGVDTLEYMLSGGGSGYAPFDWNSYVSKVTSNGDVKKTIAVDYDGNGLPDLLVEQLDSQGDSYWVALKSTRRAVEDNGVKKYFIDFISEDTGQKVEGVIPALSNASDTLPSLEPTLQKPVNIDVNADGLADLVYLDDNQWKVRYRKNKPSDLMEEATNGFGQKSKFVYAPLTDASVYTYEQDKNLSTYPYLQVMNSMLVVKQHEQSNGIGGLNSTAYQYAGATVHLRGRGFAGFRTVTVTDPLGKTLEKTFGREFPHAGKAVLAELRAPNGRLISRSRNTWAQKELQPAGKIKRYLPYMQKRVSESFDLQALATEHPISATISEITDIDDYGNIKAQSTRTGQSYDAASGTLNHVLSSTVASSTYVNATTFADWRVGFLDESTSTVTAAGNVGAISSTTDFVQKAGKLVPQSVTQHKGSAVASSSTFTYDDYGNVENVSVTAADPISTTVPTRNTVNVQYDSTGTFPQVSKNALNHSVTQKFDSRFGAPYEVTDANDLISKVTYNNFGQAISSESADGTLSMVSTSACPGDADCPANAVLSITTKVSHKTEKGMAQPRSTQYHDMLGRPLRSKTTSLDGRTILTDTEYDSFGRVTRQSNPYYKGETIYWTQYQNYDILGRPKTVLAADGGSVTFDYTSVKKGHSREQRTHNIVTPTGTTTQSTVRINNALGQLVESQDANGTKVAMAYNQQGLLRWTQVGGNADTQITARYDIAGNKTYLKDPDTGELNYQYNGLGELRKQTDARNKSITLAYDVLGRLKTQTDELGDSTWTYDQGAKAVGQVNDISGPNFNETYSYNNLGLLEKTETRLMGSNTPYVFNYAYDGFSRGKSIRYPSGVKVESVYSASGYLRQVKDGNSDTVYRNIQAMDAFGNIKTENYFHGIQTQRSYNLKTGRIESIQTSANGQSNNVQNLSYKFDSLGNLHERKSAATGQTAVTDKFSYDKLNRLDLAETFGLSGGKRVLDYEYDALGNIVSKTGAGSYTYAEHNAGVHAVTSTELAGVKTDYAYDAVGNMTQHGGTNIKYTAFNKPYEIKKGIMPVADVLTQFTYGPSRQRIYQETTHKGNRTFKTYYVAGGLYEEVIDVSRGITKQKSYLGSGLLNIKTTQVGVVGDKTETLLMHKDHIGSTDAISRIDAQGNVTLQNMSFDPFGARRKGDWNKSDVALEKTIEEIAFDLSTQGFTGHEHLDGTGFIHMGGRLYDPRTARFMSADIVVQAPAFSQSYNRYSYTLNNPLSFTDPSGYYYDPVRNMIIVTPQPYIPPPPVNVNLININNNNNFVSNVVVSTHNNNLQTNINNASSSIGGSSSSSNNNSGVHTTVSPGVVSAGNVIATTSTVGPTAPTVTAPVVPEPEPEPELLEVSVGSAGGLYAPQWGQAESAFGMPGQIAQPVAQASNPVFDTIFGGPIDMAMGAAEGNWSLFALGALSMARLPVGKGVKEFDTVPYRPTNSPYVNHHGINDVWAKNNIPGYVSRAAHNPTMALGSDAHKAAHRAGNAYLKEVFGAVRGQAKNLSPRQMQHMAERQFDAAKVPAEARQEFYREFNRYIYEFGI